MVSKIERIPASDELVIFLQEMAEGDYLEIGKGRIFYIRDAGYLVLKRKVEHEYVSGEFGYYWMKEDPNDALTLFSTTDIRTAYNDHIG